ncbi:hypothetical protein RK21_03573 [Pseudomonas plecoglossicida]|nr:hypothetical protein RK21_03573 [Pseudomonas plecoglossicida]
MAFFAGKPAPTGTALLSGWVWSLWERVYPRKGRACQVAYGQDSRAQAFLQHAGRPLPS